VEFPIYNVIHAYISNNYSLPFVKANQFEVWGRLLSIFCSLITTIYLFFLGKKWIGAYGGVFASAFYALLPFNIYFTRVILPEPMTAMFATIALYYFSKFIDTEKNSHLFVSAIAFSLAMLLKPYIAFYGIPMLYLAIKKYGISGIFKNYKLLIAFDLILIPFFAWRGWINQHPEGIPFYKWAFNGDNIRFRPAFWNWIFGERLGRLILGTWGLIPFALGLLSTPQVKNDHKKEEPRNWKAAFVSLFDNTKDYRWFLHFAALGGFLYLSVVATANVRHDYYQAILIPIIALIFANGAVFMIKNTVFPTWISRFLLMLSIGVMCIVSALQVREFYKINHPEIIAAGEAVSRLTPKDALVIAPYNGDSAFLYQTKRFGWPFVDRPIRELIQDGADYWVSVNYGDPQTIEVMKEYYIVEQTPQYIIIDLHKTK
jgi:4-amino-4-deoxy-L-arabinose transferase-like glycosyltransferase